MTQPTTKTTIAPFLSVRNGPRALAFYKAAFGATEQFLHDDGSGAIVAKLAVDGAEFWLADESPEHKNFSPETLNGGTVRMVLTVDDPDAAFQKAVAADYGWRIGRVVDPFGHHWEIPLEMETGVGRASRWNTLRALRVLRWYSNSTW
jgi:PhnB protein